MSSSVESCVLNVIGRRGTGKSTLVRHLAEEKGFTAFSPSKIIRDYARANNIPLNRTSDYIECHRSMRAEDPDIITRPVIEMWHDGQSVAIDGLRVLAHARKLQRVCNMGTMALTCPDEVRFARVLADPSRASRDNIHIPTLEDFLADENLDDGDDPFGPSISAIIAMANVEIDASLPPSSVHAQAEPFVDRFHAQQPSQQM